MIVKLKAAEEMAKALHKIRWEPIGDAEASDREILRGIEDIAQAVLSAWDKAGKREFKEEVQS